MLFYRSIICMFYCTSRVFIRYFWQKMAFRINDASISFCLLRLFNCINIGRIICLYVSIWSFISRKNDCRPKFCLWILNWKMDCLDIAAWVNNTRINSYFNCFIFLMHFKKNLIFRISSFIFCCIHDSSYKYFVPWISKI